MSTPAEHYKIADALMARVHELHEPTLPIARALVAQAQVHALLAQCPQHYSDECRRIRMRGLETRKTTGDGCDAGAV